MFKNLIFGKNDTRASKKEAIVLFFCLIIISIIILISIIFILSSIEISIENLKFSVPKIENRILNDQYQISIGIKLKKIKILKINITKTKLEKLKLKDKTQILEEKLMKNKNKFDIEFIKILKQLKIKIKKLDLEVNIGTENASLTSYLVGIISTILALLLKNKIEDCNKQKFIINPIYINKYLLKIRLDSIFEIEIIHIIYIIYILVKKGRDKKYDRTSNRRSYGYSYE